MCPALSCLKALYENMLVELPFAGFFLSKLLGTSADVDIHHLASLDPEVYRNLLFLKSYEEDVEELGLNFTVVNNDLGEAQVSRASCVWWAARLPQCWWPCVLRVALHSVCSPEIVHVLVKRVTVAGGGEIGRAHV